MTKKIDRAKVGKIFETGAEKELFLPTIFFRSHAAP
jgi:hypothetical protein